MSSPLRGGSYYEFVDTAEAIDAYVQVLDKHNVYRDFFPDELVGLPKRPTFEKLCIEFKAEDVQRQKRWDDWVGMNRSVDRTLQRRQIPRFLPQI